MSKRAYKIAMLLSTLGHYLGNRSFSMQRLKKQAYKQDEKKIENWLDFEFPAITELAKSENAEIFFSNEKRTMSGAYVPIGKTPVVRVQKRGCIAAAPQTINNPSKNEELVMYS